MENSRLASCGILPWLRPEYDYFIFMWHGGEPLMMGIPFYENVIEIQKRYFRGRTAINTFQSNCTLINPDWMSFFKLQKIIIIRDIMQYGIYTMLFKQDDCWKDVYKKVMQIARYK